jgi:branched-chain amino acid transport system permease protein
MKDPIAIMLGGLGQGGFFALIAIGIVIAFRGSGVINFAQGAIAMFIAFEFDSLRKKGTLQLPWIDFLPTKSVNIPVRIKIQEGGLGFLPSFLIALLMAVVLGFGAHFLVFRPLRNAAPLGKVIGSLGLMLYLQGIALKNFGNDNPQPSVVLPKGLYNNFLGLGKPLAKESFWLAAFAVLFGVALWAFFRFTRFGLATRAAAGNEKGAVLLGYSPERLALSNWVIASLAAGLAGILVGSVTGALNPVKFTGLVVPALGAALIGKLSSVPLATAGGIGIGLLQTLASAWLPTNKWFPLEWQSTAANALPLLVIVFVLFVSGRSLPIRGTVEEKRLPLAPYPKRVWQHSLIWSAAAIAFAYWADGRTFGFALTTTLITAMMMLSYVVLTGYVGQISLAQMSIAGCAAFMTARMLANGKPNELSPFPVSGPGLPWPIAAFIGIAFAVLVGVVLGLPALRVRGVQLAVVTMAAAVSLQSLYFENEKLTGQTAGSAAYLKNPTFFGIDLGVVGEGGLNSSLKFAIFTVVVLLALALLVANIRRSGTGRRFLAVRANERAAAAAGVNVMRTKLLAFAIASAIAGIAGVMFGFQARQISSANWLFFLSLSVLAFAYLGGITSINGAMIGGILFGNGLVTAIANHFFSNAISADLTSIIGGAALIFTAIHNPGGIAPRLQPAFRYLGSWLLKARGKEWLQAIRVVGPGAAIASIPLALLLWSKAEEWRNWFLLLVPLSGLFFRGISKDLFGFLRKLLDRSVKTAPTTQGHASPPATVSEQGA